MDKLCDLHTHSIYSDGSYTPAQLIALAEQADLSAVALCDHNTIAGLPEFLCAGQKSTVEAVPGIEFSTDYQGMELHILALFLPESAHGAVTELLADTLEKKAKNNFRLVQKLKEAGYEIDYDALIASTPRGQINRAHVAQALVEKGYAATVKEAFRNLLDPERGYYQRPPLPDSLQTISFIRQQGAVPVLAHPFLNLTETQLREYLPQAKAAGLAAMETRYPKYTGDTARLAASLATEFDILESGGSDFHGSAKPDIAIGAGRGDLQVPLTVLEALRADRKI